jgi:hypothetical protein
LLAQGRLEFHGFSQITTKDLNHEGNEEGKEKINISLKAKDKDF